MSIITNNISTRYPEKRFKEVTQGGLIFSSPLTSLKSSVSGVKMAMFGQDEFTAPIKKLLTQYGNQVIKSMVVVRSPVEKILVSAMNTMTFGKFQENMDKQNFDDLFHLQVDITLANRVIVRTEKIEVVNLEVGTTQKKGQEEEEIDDIPSGLTLNQLFENCKKRMGKNFFSYSAKSNNCQDYLLNLLQASNIGTQEDYKFIKQDTKVLFKDQTALRKVSNTLTGIGAKANILMNGGRLF